MFFRLQSRITVRGFEGNSLFCFYSCYNCVILSAMFQIMEINGQNFENISFSKAVDILRNNTHLSLTAKTNIFGKQSQEYLSSHTNAHIEHHPLQCMSMANCLSLRWWTFPLLLSLNLHPSSLQRAPQQDRAWEEERRASHSQDTGEKRQSLLHPWPSWRHGVSYRP